jgi:hypothetical protein
MWMRDDNSGLGDMNWPLALRFCAALGSPCCFAGCCNSCLSGCEMAAYGEKRGGNGEWGEGRQRAMWMRDGDGGLGDIWLLALRFCAALGNPCCFAGRCNSHLSGCETAAYGEKRGGNGERGGSTQCGRETAMVGWATSGPLPSAFALRWETLVALLGLCALKPQ